MTFSLLITAVHFLLYYIVLVISSSTVRNYKNNINYSKRRNTT